MVLQLEAILDLIFPLVLSCLIKGQICRFRCFKICWVFFFSFPAVSISTNLIQDLVSFDYINILIVLLPFLPFHLSHTLLVLML